MPNLENIWYSVSSFNSLHYVIDSIFYHRKGIVTTCVKQLDAWLMAFMGVRDGLQAVTGHGGVSTYNITVTRERL